MLGVIEVKYMEVQFGYSGIESLASHEDLYNIARSGAILYRVEYFNTMGAKMMFERVCKKLNYRLRSSGSKFSMVNNFMASVPFIVCLFYGAFKEFEVYNERDWFSGVMTKDVFAHQYRTFQSVTALL